MLEQDQPLGVPPSEFHPHRPEVPFKKRGKLKTAIIVGVLIVLLDLFIYFFLIKPDDSQLLKAIEPLKPPSATQTPTTIAPTQATNLIPSPTSQVQISNVSNLAIAELAKKLNINPAQIKIVSEEKVEWNDGSMGCPDPDMMYTQALVDGTKVILSAEKKTYDYHAGTDGKPFLCEKPSK